MKSFVLIPGAWHTACSWLPVARRLRDAGESVDIVELPGQRMVNNEPPSSVHLVDAIQAVVDHVQNRDLRESVLVGHSLGGYVIGGALTALADRVRQVLYYSAHIPLPGLCMADAFPDRMAPLRAAAQASPDGSVPVPAAQLVRAAFVPDSSADLQQLIGDLLVPTPAAYFLEAIARPTRPSDHGIDFHYLLGEDDLILPPPAYQFPAMLGVAAVMVPGGHEALFTNPDPLASMLLDLAS